MSNSAWHKIAKPASATRPAALSMTPDAFVAYLKELGISAFHFAYDASKDEFHLSHDFLKPVVEFFLADPLRDWDNHEAVFVRVANGVLQSASIQHTKRGAAAGGVRNWLYTEVEGFFRDGMRLAKGMGSKNALAGLWWGGGKGVMARNSGKGLQANDEPALRKAAYTSYGTFMSALKGCYVTAEDVGTNVEDMAAIHSMTRHTTCIPERLGGSGNPSIPTARGIATAIETAFIELGMDLKGAKIGIVGLGNVGSYVARYLLETGVGEIVATDADPSTVTRVQSSLLSQFPTAKLSITSTTSLDPLLASGIICLSPCATGGLLSKDSIPKIAAAGIKIVCGAANNQLLDVGTDGELLHQKGVLYCPDFVVNRMGIVNCANEYAGILPPDVDPMINSHFLESNPDGIPAVVRKIIQQSKASGKSTQSIAIALADEKMRELNPLLGHRAFEIIKYIAESEAPGKEPRWIEWLKAHEK